MRSSTILARTILLLGIAAVMGNAGCPAPPPISPPDAPAPPAPPPPAPPPPGPPGPTPPPASIIEVELINETANPVDPALFVDDTEIVIDPPIASGDVVVLEVDCFAGTTLQTDALLLTPLGAIASENAPFLEEGFEFLCDDVVSFFFTRDAFGFFTEVAVNGVFLPIDLTPPLRTVEVELVNITSDFVEPGLFVDGSPIIIEPPVAAGDIVVLEVDCFPGATLETNARLLSPFGPIFSQNTPLVQESFDFLCGDIITFIFRDDVFAFFTSVEINGVPLP